MTKTLRSIKTLLRFAFEAQPRLMLTMVFLSLLSAGSLFGAALSLKLVTEAVLEPSVSKGVIGGVMAAVSLAAAIGFFPIGAPLDLALQESVSTLVDRRLMALTAAVPNLELHDRPEYQSKLQLLLHDRFPMNSFTTTFSLNVIMVALIIGVAVVLGMQHPLLALVPLLAVPTVWLGIVGERIWRRAQDATAEQFRLRESLFQLATDPQTGKELRIFGLGDELISRHSQSDATVRRALDRASWMSTGFRSLAWTIFTVAYAGGVLVVVYRATQGLATPGDVILTVALAAPISLVAGLSAGTLNATWQAITAAERYLWLQDLAANSSRSPANEASIPHALHDGIRFEEVGFRYPGSDDNALIDVTLELPAGSVVALVGENGAGKTTLIKLLSRLYDPTSGEITVDGVDLRRLAHASWRERISSGFQDFVQFEVLARETVGLGDLPRINDVPAVSAGIERAGAADVLEGLPDGLETQLGKEWDGAEISTGQWQKFALSRAFMRDKPLLLILDEPTAALDAAAEHSLFERFASATREGREAHDRITILVSHRFSTVRMADLIIVLDGGRVVESGSHAELVRSGGLYANLYEIQASAYR